MASGSQQGGSSDRDREVSDASNREIPERHIPTMWKFRLAFAAFITRLKRTTVPRFVLGVDRAEPLATGRTVSGCGGVARLSRCREGLARPFQLLRLGMTLWLEHSPSSSADSTRRESSGQQQTCDGLRAGWPTLSAFAFRKSGHLPFCFVQCLPTSAAYLGR